MKAKWGVLAVAIGATVLGFLLEGAGPIGAMIWPPADGPQPEGAALALLMMMGLIEAMAFGVGIAFLVFGWGWVKRVTADRVNTTLVYVSIGWLLINWVPHTAMHMHQGNILVPADFMGLVWIEYMFHFTLIIAGCILAAFFLRAVPILVSGQSRQSAAAAKKEPKAAA